MNDAAPQGPDSSAASPGVEQPGGRGQAPAVAAPSFPQDVYIHLLEDEIWHLRETLAELIRLHYGLDDPPKG